MNPEVKQRWLDALRSGKYKQGKRYLRAASKQNHDSYAYCCLGVLCDLMNPKGWRGSLFTWSSPADQKIGYLPDSLGRELGLPHELQCSLAQMNDSDEADFNEIAEWIEANL